MRDLDAARWDLTPKEAVALQRQLAARVERDDHITTVRRIAGVDAGFPSGGKITRVALVVMSFPGLERLEEVIVEQPTRFSYIPGLLSFREVPVMLDGLARLKLTPDVILCDGHGIAHPRRFGSASHLGLASGIPTVGVGKPCLVGDYEEPPAERGEWTPLAHKDERIGAVVRTRSKVKPVFVSTGHSVGLASAIDLVFDCAPRFRVPEPIRAADKLASS